MVRVVHVISGLGQGGAETMLAKLLGAMDRRRVDAAVVSLLDKGLLGPRIEALGVPVHALGMRRGVPSPTALLRLFLLLRRLRPDLVQTWMYHADLLGGLAARAGHIPVAWNIRQSDLDPNLSKRSTRWTARACASLSRVIPRRIVCCSSRAAQVHQALGYCPDRMVVIPNGFDTRVFQPDPARRASTRRRLGISDGEFLVGLVARFDPQKDHGTFIEAAGQVAALRPSARFLLCGEGIDHTNPELGRWIDRASVGDRSHLLGRRDDIPQLMPGLDLAVSSSAFGEGFPNVLGEAMASGVSCVATDVGDSAEILGDSGRSVPPRRPEALAAAILEMIDLPAQERRRLGEGARQRVLERFGIEAVAARYEALYLDPGGRD